MNRVSYVRARLDGIPVVLRIASIASIGIGVLFPVIALIPSTDFNVGGTELSWRELWRTGAGFAILAVGLLTFVVGVGILHRACWARFVLIFLPLLQILPFQIAYWVCSAPDPTPSREACLLSIGIWGILSAAYLFGAASAREFFSARKAEIEGDLD